MNSDVDCCTILVFLDPSLLHLMQSIMVFLIDRLENWVGVTGMALDWFKSYLNSRTFSVSVWKILLF